MLLKLFWYLLNRKFADGVYTQRIRSCMVLLANGTPVICEIGKVSLAEEKIQVRVFGADKTAKVNGSSWLWIPIYQTMATEQKLFMRKLAKYCKVKRGIFEKVGSWYARVQYTASKTMVDTSCKPKK